MKKVKSVLIFLILIALTLTGCNNIDVPPPPDEVARLQSVDIIKYFKNKDIESIKNMFSKKVSDNCNLNEEIQEAFDVIDGSIISYDTPDGSSGGGTIEYGERIEQKLTGKIEKIKTDKQKTYEIGFASYSQYKNNVDLIGLVVISVRDSDNKTIATIGGWEKTGVINGQ